MSNTSPSRGIINTFGVYQEYYESAILAHKTSSAISWIGTIQGFLLFLVCLLAGPLFDRGYFRYIILSGTFLLVFGMMMTSLATSYYQILLAQGICVGLGAGCLFLPSLAIVATYFTTKRALMTGITAAGGSIGTQGDELRNNYQLTFDLRRRHISHRIPQTSAYHWFRMGDTGHWLYGSRITLYQPSHHANPNTTTQARTCYFRSQGFPRSILQHLQLCPLPRLHWTLLSLFLCTNLRLTHHGAVR